MKQQKAKTGELSANGEVAKSAHPFRKAVLRGLAILMPPLLTIVLFIWAWTIIERNVLQHVEKVAVRAFVMLHKEVLDKMPPDLNENQLTRDSAGRVVAFHYENRVFRRNNKDQWVGYLTDEYVREHHLTRTRTLPAFLAVFLLILYLLGKFVAAGVGRMIVGSSEALISRLPVVSNVYASVKQVTDFFLTEQEIEFNRVVAVEYPRRGIWSVGFVTGESMLDIRSAANEPVLSVLMPTSPMPVTGFTITVRKSEVVDLNITIDQAIQFIVSCGVVVPLQQQVTPGEVAGQITAMISDSDDAGPPSSPPHGSDDLE